MTSRAKVSRTAGSGRPSKGIVWQHILQSPSLEASGKVRYECRHCNKTWLMSARQCTKMAEHLVGCDACPTHIRKEVSRACTAVSVQQKARACRLFELDPPVAAAAPVSLASASAESPSTLGSPSIASTASTKSGSSRPVKKQRLVTQYHDFCDKARADEINMTLMALLASCGLAFILVETPYFVRFVRSLNSRYADVHLPKADCFTKTWLPKLFEATETEVGELWKSKKHYYRTLGTDGFTNEQSRKVTIITESIGDQVSQVGAMLDLPDTCLPL